MSRLLSCIRVFPSFTSSYFNGSRHFWRGRDPFYDFESGLRYVERQMKDTEREMRRIFDDFHTRGIFPNFVSPWFGRQVPIETAGDKEKFCLKLDVVDYKPEEIKVTVKNNLLTIHAKKEVTKDGGKIFKEYTHQYTLPEQVNPETVRSVFNSDGTLIVEAPIKALESKEIPVENVKDDKEK